MQLLDPLSGIENKFIEWTQSGRVQKEITCKYGDLDFTIIFHNIISRISAAANDKKASVISTVNVSSQDPRIRVLFNYVKEISKIHGLCHFPKSSQDTFHLRFFQTAFQMREKLEYETKYNIIKSRLIDADLRDHFCKELLTLIPESVLDQPFSLKIYDISYHNGLSRVKVINFSQQNILIANNFDLIVNGRAPIEFASDRQMKCPTDVNTIAAFDYLGQFFIYSKSNTVGVPDSKMGFFIKEERLYAIEIDFFAAHLVYKKALPSIMSLLQLKYPMVEKIGEHDILVHSLKRVGFSDESLDCPKPGKTYSEARCLGFSFSFSYNGMPFTINTVNGSKIVSKELDFDYYPKSIYTVSIYAALSDKYKEKIELNEVEFLSVEAQFDNNTANISYSFRLLYKGEFSQFLFDHKGFPI